MNVVPVLMLTNYTAVWNHWKEISAANWLPARGRSLEDLQRWRQQGRHLVMLDASLPQLPEHSDARWKHLFESMNIVVLSVRPNDEAARHLLAWGACGYAHAYSTPATLNSIIDAVAKGHIWIGRTLLNRLLRDISDRLSEPDDDCLHSLSSREQEVARLASRGYSNSEIATRLSVTERTVRAHVSSVFEKLQVQDRLALVLKVHGIAK